VLKSGAATRVKIHTSMAQAGRPLRAPLCPLSSAIDVPSTRNLGAGLLDRPAGPAQKPDTEPPGETLRLQHRHQAGVHTGGAR